MVEAAPSVGRMGREKGFQVREGWEKVLRGTGGKRGLGCGCKQAIKVREEREQGLTGSRVSR